MADNPLGAEPSQGNSGWRRNWLAYQDYLAIQASQLEQCYRRGLIVRSTINRLEQHDPDGQLLTVSTRGNLFLDGSIVIRFHEFMSARRGRNGRDEVLGLKHSYHIRQGTARR